MDFVREVFSNPSSHCSRENLINKVKRKLVDVVAVGNLEGESVLECLTKIVGSSSAVGGTIDDTIHSNVEVVVSRTGVSDILLQVGDTDGGAKIEES